MLDLLSDVADWLAAIPWDAVGIGGAVVAAVAASLHFGHVMRIAWVKGRRREKLGVFLREGQGLHSRCMDEKKSPPKEEGQDWLERAEEYLATLGSDYVASFHSSAGLPLPFTVPGSWHPDRVQTERGISFRLARLQQFLDELRR